MSQHDDLRELAAEIAGFADIARVLDAAIDRLIDHDIPSIGRNSTTAVAAAGLIENYYTAVETVLYRIAQVFGNNLDPQRWHSDLLRRMCVSIPDVRPRVLSEITYSRLDELMRFRHFKRYYFHLEFDWQRLEHLLVVARGLVPLLHQELEAFHRFVVDVMEAGKGNE